MESPASLAQALRHHVQHAGITADRLAKESTVSKPTLVHWLKGHVKKPHHWKPLLLVAAALHLDERQATLLLLAASHPPLDQLRPHIRALVSSCKGREHVLLERWVHADGERVLPSAPKHLLAVPFDAVPAPAPLPHDSRMPLQHR